MYDDSEFGEIRPYTDAETVEALKRVSRHPMTPVISKYLFPDMPAGTLAHMLRGIGSIDQFQDEVMFGVVEAVLARTSKGFTCSGEENLKALEGKRFLAVSNHRDIVLDPALIQYEMKLLGLPYTEICVGSNLITGQLTEDLMRSNRMIKVIRGIGARQLYLSSLRLSRYIRESITSGRASIWIAQREGRTKNGCDTTEQGLLKMFDLSGEGCFEENFCALNIVPMSISYEYESCDSRKAREVLLRREGPYTKKPKEDLHSILTGIVQWKGRVHMALCEPIRTEDLTSMEGLTNNEYHKAVAGLIDQRINGAYQLWPNNYVAHDMLYGNERYRGMYTDEEREAFRHHLAKLDRYAETCDIERLREIFLGIYANPVDVKH